MHADLKEIVEYYILALRSCSYLTDYHDFRFVREMFIEQLKDKGVYHSSYKDTELVEILDNLGIKHSLSSGWMLVTWNHRTRPERIYWDE